MDTSSLGKWAWLIGLVVLIVWGLLATFGVSTGMDATIGSVAVLLAFLGGIFYISGMKDRTGFLITAIALAAVASAPWSLWGIETYLTPIFAGAAAAALAAAAGVLLVVVYEWLMSYSK